MALPSRCPITNHVHLIPLPAHARSMVLTFREATRTGKLSGALGLAAEREARLARTHCSVKPGPKSKRDGPCLFATE